MTAITITAETIAKLEAKGFNRWTKGNMDRLYIDAKNYGAEFVYYNSGNIRSAKFQGERISNADGRRLNATKAYIDIATGELHIQTDYYYDDEIREAIEAIIAEVETEIEAEEAARAEEEAEAETANENEEDTMTEYDTDLTTFAIMTDAIEYVETALGEHAEDFDAEAIAHEVTDWVDGKLTLTADGDEFWAVVMQHDATDNASN